MFSNEFFLIGPWLHKSNSIYRLRDKDKQPLVSNSPMVLLTGITSHSIFITGDSIHLDHGSNVFAKSLMKLESTIYKECIKRQFLNPTKQPLQSVVKDWNGTPYIRIWTSSHEDNCKTHCFTKNNNTYEDIELTDISKGSLVQVRLWVRDFTIYQTHCELHLVAHQILLKDPLSKKKCLILDDSTVDHGDNSLSRQPKKPMEDKYEKMLRMGIPQHVVERKKKIDLTYSNSSKPEFPVQLLSGILGGKSSLKKTNHDLRPKKIFKKPNIPGCVPSLDEILQQRNSLNTTSFNKMV